MAARTEDRPATCQCGCEQLDPTILEAGPPSRWLRADCAARELAEARARARERRVAAGLPPEPATGEGAIVPRAAISDHQALINAGRRGSDGRINLGERRPSRPGRR